VKEKSREELRKKGEMPQGGGQQEGRHREGEGAEVGPWSELRAPATHPKVLSVDHPPKPLTQLSSKAGSKEARKVLHRGVGDKDKEIREG